MYDLVKTIRKQLGGTVLYSWRQMLRHDPCRPLLQSGNRAILFFSRRDLLDEQGEPLHLSPNLPEIQALLRQQKEDGAFMYPGPKKTVYPAHHYALVETFKRFRLLVRRFGLTHDHDAIKRAAEYLFSCQTPKGDFRGFIGNQYATYYTGAVTALLIRAGYAHDSRVGRSMRRLLAMRQDDGGWSIPLLTHRLNGETIYHLTSSYAESLEPDRTQPFSHNWTNMVLEAFAYHPHYRESVEARKAGILLKGRFFQPDRYSSYRQSRYWVRFVHWWPNLLTALESLSGLGFSGNDPDIRLGLDWFIKNQREDGLWDLENDGKQRRLSAKNREDRLWLGLGVCRMLKKLPAR